MAREGRHNTLIGRPRRIRIRRPRLPGRGLGFGGFGLGGFGGGLGGGLIGGGAIGSLGKLFATKTVAPKPAKPKHQPRTKMARAHKKNTLVGAGTHPQAKGPTKSPKPLKNPFRRSTGYNVK